MRVQYARDASLPDGGAIDAGTQLAADYGGLAGLEGWLDALRPTAPNPVLVTSGDLFGGVQQLNILFDDAPTLEGMARLGLRFTTVGEADLLRGAASLRARMGDGGLTWVTTNLTNAQTDLPQATRGYALLDVGTARPPVRVAFLGLSSPELEPRAGLGRLGSMTVTEPVAATVAAARSARAAGADVVVALAHFGAVAFDDAGVPVGPLMTYAQAVAADVDVVIGDRNDFDFVRSVGGALVVQGRSRGRTLHQIAVSVVDGGVVSKQATVFETNLTPVTLDGGLAALLAPYRAGQAARLSQRIGSTTARFVRSTSHERLGEANIGNLLADAMLARYRTTHGAQIAFTNGGGIRDALPSQALALPADAGFNRVACTPAQPCDVVRGDAYSVQPFSVACVIRTVTPQQLWQALEWSVAALPSTSGRFLQIAGLQFTYDVTLAAGARVTSVKLCRGGHATTDAGVVGRECVNPLPLAPMDATPIVAVTNDFTNTGGDGYGMLVQPEELSWAVDNCAESLADAFAGSAPVTLPCPGLTTACGLSATSPIVCNNASDRANTGSTCRALGAP